MYTKITFKELKKIDPKTLDLQGKICYELAMKYHESLMNMNTRENNMFSALKSIGMQIFKICGYPNSPTPPSKFGAKSRMVLWHLN